MRGEENEAIVGSKSIHVPAVFGLARHRIHGRNHSLPGPVQSPGETARLMKGIEYEEKMAANYLVQW